MSKFLPFLLLIVKKITTASSHFELDLTRDENKWLLSTCATSGGINSVAAKVPGNAHTDLMNAKVLSGDPYFRFNEVNMSWVALQCWAYELTGLDFENQENNSPSMLRLEGVDTVGSVFLNNVLIGHCNNAFRTYHFEIEPQIVKAGASNVLRIEMSSAAIEAKIRAGEYPYEVPATENYNVWAEPSSRNFVRKAGSDFGAFIIAAKNF